MTTHRSFAVKRTATGLGLFALRPIPSDKRIIEYTGPVLSDEEATLKGGKYLFEIDKNQSVDGNNRRNIARYINHSCHPNAKAFSTAGRIWIWSKRMILTGEEITLNYGSKYVDEHIKPKGCRCEKCVA